MSTSDRSPRRRAFHRYAGATVASIATTRVAGAPRRAAPSAASPSGANPATHDMSAFPPHWQGREHIALIVYPQFTALDLVGPQYMFANLMGATVRVVARTRDPVRADTGLVFTPDLSFDELRDTQDLIFVPGGTEGTLAAMRDAPTLAFLADHGARARWVTSVCTGSLVLAAAGLLEGYRATSHWMTRDLLREFGAVPVARRFVFDRNRVTGAGVTAGIDFGLELVRRLRDDDYARAVQLLAEYDPHPPLKAGTPRGAGPRITAIMQGMLTGFVAQVREVAAQRRPRG